jgi:hypothetical protein
MGWRRPDVGSNEHAERVPHPQRIAVVSGTLGTAIERRTGEARVLAPTGGSTQPPPMRSALSSTSRTSTAARRIGLECGHPYVSPKPAWWHSSGPFATESQASACELCGRRAHCCWQHPSDMASDDSGAEPQNSWSTMTAKLAFLPFWVVGGGPSSTGLGRAWQVTSFLA